MIKHLFMAGLLTVGASAAYAQQATTPPRAADPQVAAMPSGADAKKLIGRNVKNPQDETVGEIESVYINADGKVDSVILGVGGFLGVGERHVRVAWKDLRISDNGEKVVINATKDELKGMAPYTYRDPKMRGQVFTDTGVYAPAAARDPKATATATESTGDFNAHGAVSGNALIGAKVHNAAKETVGSVEDVYLDAKGAVEFGRRLGRRLPRRRQQGRRREVVRPEDRPRRQVPDAHHQLDQGQPQGDAGLQVRASPARAFRRLTARPCGSSRPVRSLPPGRAFSFWPGIFPCPLFATPRNGRPVRCIDWVFASRRTSMCDYSLEIYRSRPAVQGEQYSLHRFRSGTIGFVAPADRTTAVCMPEGARLRLEGLNEEVQRTLLVGPAEAVEIIRLPHRGHTHRDGIRFADGREVLLQSLNVGTTATLVPRDLAELFDLKAGAGSTWRRFSLSGPVRRSRARTERGNSRLAAVGRSAGGSQACQPE